ncbi:unnamed protein product [Blepharisma stoltei]|uniref:Uncharacterized protein n=1 Tax=Blepharisma stoltei TaxID=1481888 RepID=A0AAU9JDH5_9CILI|nr:unnamed protein product [Blepharisma stoltei]
MENRNFEGFVFTFYSKTSQLNNSKIKEQPPNPSHAAKSDANHILKPLKMIRENLKKIRRAPPLAKREALAMDESYQINTTERHIRESTPPGMMRSKSSFCNLREAAENSDIYIFNRVKKYDKKDNVCKLPPIIHHYKKKHFVYPSIVGRGFKINLLA